jgi:hypothetical protein
VTVSLDICATTSVACYRYRDDFTKWKRIDMEGQ